VFTPVYGNKLLCLTSCLDRKATNGDVFGISFFPFSSKEKKNEKKKTSGQINEGPSTLMRLCIIPLQFIFNVLDL